VLYHSFKLDVWDEMWVRPESAEIIKQYQSMMADTASASANQGNPGNRGKENGGNLSNGSSQSARKNTATVSAEQTANSTRSSLS
jgi:S-ribosylhomocysteine lyase LuxS involved in autoinducer biosynthesis